MKIVIIVMLFVLALIIVCLVLETLVWKEWAKEEREIDEMMREVHEYEIEWEKWNRKPTKN